MDDPKTKIFEGGDKQTALDLALMWVNNHKEHPPVFVEEVVATPEGGKWIAVVTYREA